MVGDIRWRWCSGWWTYGGDGAVVGGHTVAMV